MLRNHQVVLVSQPAIIDCEREAKTAWNRRPIGNVHNDFRRRCFYGLVLSWLCIGPLTYVDRIGELSLLKNMMETMEVLGVDPQADLEGEKVKTDTPTTTEQNSQGSSDYDTTSTTSPRKTAYPAITAGPHSSPAVATPDKGSKKRKELTPEQKEKLQQIQQEQENVRKERVAILSKKLLDKISVWVETDHSANVTEAFKKKMQVCLLIGT